MDDVRADTHRKALQLALFHNVEYTGQIARTIESKARALIHQKSFSLLDDSVRSFDVVKDVVNLAPIHWIADTLVCHQP
jgi:linoleate 10R-lipoxygenase